MRQSRSVISLCALLLTALAGVLLTGCPQGSPAAAPLVSTRAYSGHENDQDANNFVRAYPACVGSRLDDCQLCHRAGVALTSTKKIYNPCTYCHLIPFPDSSYTTGVPANYQATLNSFGLAYENAGRTVEAFATIASQDADLDTYTNADEIADKRFPGNSNSKPGLPFAPTKTVTLAQIQAMTQHPQFLLMNTSKQKYDDYATYNGPTLKSFLLAAGVDLTGATGVTVFAPDGFGQDFSMDALNDWNTPTSSVMYPDTKFFSAFFIGQPFSNTALDFVNYPSSIPINPDTGNPFQNGEFIKGRELQLAWQRDGNVLSTSYYDPTTGRLEGEGPFRVVPPQKNNDALAGQPDRGSQYTQAVPDDGWNNKDSTSYPSFDHNAGSSPRGACIIRVNPMPVGTYEEYDTSNGWSLIPLKSVIIYGSGVN
jgi:hypothetical protein